MSVGRVAVHLAVLLTRYMRFAGVLWCVLLALARPEKLFYFRMSFRQGNLLSSIFLGGSRRAALSAYTYSYTSSPWLSALTVGIRLGGLDDHWPLGRLVFCHGGDDECGVALVFRG